MKFKSILISSLLFICIFVCGSVNAANFGTMDARINQNNKILNEANNMNWAYRSSLQNLEYKEFRETNYQGLNASQLSRINNLASTILGDSSYTDKEKLEKFYDFILDNFYFYNTPNKISALSNNYKFDNPYYLITYEYDQTGKVRARSNGYAMTFLMLARSQNIPARIVGGYYNKSVRDEYAEWGSNITGTTVNHVWVEAYVDRSWHMFDPTADSYKIYNDATLEYIDELNVAENQNSEIETQNENNSNEEDNQNENNSNENENNTNNESENQNENNTSNEYQKRYFMPTMEELSKTHIAFKTYVTSNNIKYVSNGHDRNQLLSFLNQKSGNYTNGRRINSSYNTTDSSTWFVKNDKSSVTDGYGRIKRIYWPNSKSLGGNLQLKSLNKLEVLSVQKNKIKYLRVTESPNLKTVNVSNNQMTKVIVTGSKLTYFNAEGNPSTYVEYQYNSNKKRAIVKANSGGTVSVKYSKGSGTNKHYLKARTKSGYIFKGWYNGKKLLSKKASYNIKQSKSFTYVAKFQKVPTDRYIKISISKQKLQYYKKGKVVYTSNVVTGQKGLHNTPKGTFRIQGKARNIYLVGRDYRNFVSFWMPIYGDIGMHDASWRWYFGGTIYKYNGSHGCINLPYNTARYIYNNAPVGTKVKVVN